MARGAKASKTAPPTPMPPNMAAVNDALSKARALVGSIKRVRSSEPVGATVAVKAKASVPTPQVAVEAKASPATLPPPPPPTRVREKSSATTAAAKALPPPPPKAVEAVLPTEISPPKSCGLTPSQRTQAYLKSVKDARLAEGGTLHTPPPKRPAPSPESTPTPPSQVPATGSQGGDAWCDNGDKSSRWWDHDKKEQQHWWWDHENNHYVVTQGDASWICKEEWDGLRRSWSWDDATSVAETPRPSPNDFDNSSSPGEIAAELAARRPSLAELPSPAPPSPTAVEAPDNSGISTDTPAAEEDPKYPDSEVPSAPSTKTTPSTITADGEDGKDFNKDKYGNVLTPEALYMRFYRKLRSVSDPSKLSHVWMGVCWDKCFNCSITSSLFQPQQI